VEVKKTNSMHELQRLLITILMICLEPAYILRNLVNQDHLQQLDVDSLTDLERQQRGLLMTILGMILISNWVLDQGMQ
jgi:hypothetical protein